MSEQKKTLRDSEMHTVERPGRRRMLGLLALGGAATLASGRAHAQGSDSDNGTWADQASCPRGPGGTYTGVTDSDSGTQADQGGYGRGEPYC